MDWLRFWRAARRLPPSYHHCVRTADCPRSRLPGCSEAVIDGPLCHAGCPKADCLFSAPKWLLWVGLINGRYVSLCAPRLTAAPVAEHIMLVKIGSQCGR